jgi:hypothetical protein
MTSVTPPLSDLAQHRKPDLGFHPDNKAKKEWRNSGLLDNAQGRKDAYRRYPCGCRRAWIRRGDPRPLVLLSPSPRRGSAAASPFNSAPSLLLPPSPSPAGAAGRSPGGGGGGPPFPARSEVFLGQLLLGGGADRPPAVSPDGLVSRGRVGFGAAAIIGRGSTWWRR